MIKHIQCGIECVKTAADVFAPVSGDIIGINKTVGTDPGLVNKSAEKDGWLFKIKVQNSKDLGKKLSTNKLKYY